MLLTVLIRSRIGYNSKVRDKDVSIKHVQLSLCPLIQHRSCLANSASICLLKEPVVNGFRLPLHIAFYICR